MVSRWWPVRRSMLLIPFFSTRCLQMFVICGSVRCFLYRGVFLVWVK
jgi:hypothetical protein